MIERLTTKEFAEKARQQISALFASHAEWFYSTDDGDLQALRRGELDFSVSQGRLIFSCWTDKGTRVWRVRGWEWTGEKLLLKASGRMGAEQPLIELVPRASASAIAATVRAARQARCDRLAELACSSLIGAKVERAALSPGLRRGQPGRYARIVLRLKHQRIAVTASVSTHKASEADAFLSAALLWFIRISQSARAPYLNQFWIVLEGELVKPTVQRVALLREGFKEALSIFAIDESWTELTAIDCPERTALFQRRLTRFATPAAPVLSGRAKEIIAEAPDAIDVVYARHGETLRYFGLAFARVRRLMGVERVWFGIEGSQRRLLEEHTEHDWSVLLGELREHRCADASDHHHALYRTASEAWLESLLRRDVTKLDPGLIIAPLHAQFRTPRGGRLGVRPIDLLALRQDGRLVVIELKVAEDREHVLQGVDYWYRVEGHRRRGHIARAKLFGDRHIRDETPLVYLVAPTLRVHPSMQTLARLIASDIEIYRFDINEDWRAGVRVMRRMRIN